MKTIPLTNSPKFALVDDLDFRIVKSFTSWRLDNGYVCSRSGKKYIRMHNLIMKPPPGFIVDHLNHVTYDNQRQNLRICTVQQNLFNQKPNKHGRFSKYKGVTKGVNKPYRGTIRDDEKNLHDWRIRHRIRSRPRL